MSSVKEIGESVPAETWQKALSCGNMIDRFPCKRCSAKGFSQCEKPLTPSEIDATRDYINRYGYAAARRLAGLPSLSKDTTHGHQ